MKRDNSFPTSDWRELETEAEALLKRDEGKALTKRIDEAIRLYEQAFNLAEEASAEPIHLARLRLEVGTLYRQDGRIKTALDRLNEGIYHVSSGEYPLRTLEDARLKVEIAYCYAPQQEWTEVKTWAAQAISVLESTLDDQLDRPAAYSALGDAYNMLTISSHELDEREDFFKFAERARGFYASAGDRPGELDMQANILAERILRGQYHLVIDTITEDTLQEYFEITPERVSLIYQHLAIAYTDAGVPSKAIEYAKHSYQEAEEEGDFLGQLRAYETWVYALREQAIQIGSRDQESAYDVIDEMRRIWNQGMGLADEHPTPEWASEVANYAFQGHCFLAEAYLSVDDIARAANEIVKLESQESLVDPDIRAQGDVIQAILAEKQGQTEKAQSLLVQARDLFDQEGRMGKLVQTDIRRAQIEYDLGNFEQALDILAKPDGARDWAQRLNRDRDEAEIKLLVEEIRGRIDQGDAKVEVKTRSKKPATAQRVTDLSMKDSVRDHADGLRLQQLVDNIRQDLGLLKDYEDTLRYEDDPRRKAKYRRKIEELRESVANYQREYEELQTRESTESWKAMREIGSQLRQMDVKIDELVAGQTTIRDSLDDLQIAVLDRFEASERDIVASILDRLNRTQLEIVREILDAIEDGTVSESELQKTLDAFLDALESVQQGDAILADRDLGSKIETVSEAAEAPRLGVKNKLKVTVPIIPILLAYEGEIELGSGINLETVWQNLLARVRG